MNEKTPIRNIVYPGHPLVVALCALKVFSSAREALSPCAQGWSNMVCCSAIPGSGDAAYAGDHLLRSIWDGTPIEKAITCGDEMWCLAHGPGTDTIYDFERGQAQADSYKDEFRTLCAQWDWSK